ETKAIKLWQILLSIRHACSQKNPAHSTRLDSVDKPLWIFLPCETPIDRCCRLTAFRRSGALCGTQGCSVGESGYHSSRYQCNFFKRRATSSAFSRLLNAEMRKYPSPCAPKPLPGVMTTLKSRSMRSNICQLVRPSRVFTQM